MLTPEAVGEAVRRAALALGFARVGFASADRFEEAALALRRWLAAGEHGSMAYLDGELDRADPRALLPEARSVIVVALAGPRPRLAPLRRDKGGPPLTGRVAAYALGEDYHTVIREKLMALAVACERIVGRPVRARACVDTAPLLEREAARRAGVGFTGKSTLTLVPGLGSDVLLGELLVDIALPPTPAVPPGCGGCTACLEACPTGAFVDAYHLDARRCIAYLTIELTGPIPRELRASIGTRVFGCDECQAVCPFNASAAPRPVLPEMIPRAELVAPELISLLELTSSGYRRLVKRSALRRVSRNRLARNAAVALGNSGDARAVEPLVRALEGHGSALVRGHAAWALGRLGGAAAESALRRATDADADASVRQEATDALAELS